MFTHGQSIPSFVKNLSTATCLKPFLLKIHDPMGLNQV